MIPDGGEGGRGLMFLGPGLGSCNACMKNGGLTGCSVYAAIFKRVLDIIRIKIRHLNGENKWEIAGVNYTHDDEFIWL